MVIRLLTLGAALFVTGTQLAAHDFWIAAAHWTLAPEGRITVTANVGDSFPKGTNYTTPERVEQWRVIGASGDVPLAREFRREGESLATDFSLPAPGAYLGVMVIQARVADMKGPSFTKYLQEEGLDDVIAARAKAGEAEKTAKERYARYAKVAIRNGAGGGAHLTRPVGLTAEFIPATDPTQLHPGQSLTLQLVARGKPVAGAAVAALHDGGGEPLKARTDADGRVTLRIDRAGAWLVRTVHMERLTQATPQDPDWESYWVTLSFHTASH